VLAPFELGQIAVHDANGRAVVLADQRDLDRARARRQRVGAGVAPADYEPPRRLELEVAAADGDAVDVERELAVGPRVEDSLRRGDGLSTPRFAG
jgi:hypothetical protein